MSEPVTRDFPDTVDNCIVRGLAGFTRADRPQFLEIPFNGLRAMEEMCSHDPGHT